MSAELPRCSVCRLTIKPGAAVVFSSDGRVHHSQCPKVVCPICSTEILPDTPIRRDGEALIHGNCWMRRYRQHVGVSAPAQRDRAEIVRARLVAGSLPGEDPTKVWGGASTGAVCGGCTDRILSGQVEYEVQFANTLLFRLHRTCYLIWEKERTAARREISGGSAPSAWTLVFDLGIARRAAADDSACDDLLMAAAEACGASAQSRAASMVLRAKAARSRSVSQQTRATAERLVATRVLTR